MWLDPDWICNWVCEEIQSQIRYPKNLTPRTFQGRNFGSNKPIIENLVVGSLTNFMANTLVASILAFEQEKVKIFPMCYKNDSFTYEISIKKVQFREITL